MKGMRRYTVACLYERGRVLLRTAAAALAVFSAIQVSGCSQDNREIEKSILSQDQSFRTVIRKRDLLNAELVSLKAAYIKITETIDSEITALRDKKARTRKEYLASAEKIRFHFQPEVRKVEREISDIRRRYDQKSAELKQIEKDANEVGSLIKRKDNLILTDEEMKTWNDRLSELSARKSAVLSEIEKMKRELDLNRQKLKVLKLK